MKTVFDRRYVSKHAKLYDEPGQCRRCGRELIVLGGQRRRTCSKPCRRRVQHLPAEEKARLRATVTPGVCLGCGAELPPDMFQCPKAQKAWLRNWRNAAGGKLRFGPEAFEWLARKLGLDASDERLPEIAMRLAESGRLTVLVDGDRIVGIAKPKAQPRRESRAA